MRRMRLGIVLVILLVAGPIASETEAQGGSGPGTPLLYGVILGTRGWVAYIEDPTTRTVAPYRVGDTVAGQTVQAIEEERVLLSGPGGTFEIRLSDEKPGTRRRPAPR
jgi:hypothetical protein